jgi:tyrosyl-tRNA synthetase
MAGRCDLEQSLEKQMSVIRRRAVEIITEEELEEKIKRAIETGKPLRIKLGLDPNRPDIHIGHMVVIDKLRDFQDLGHEVVLIVGTFTGFIGDPSARDSTRPRISLEEVMQHAGTYFEQVQRVLDPDKTQIVSNADWLMPLNFAEILGIASKVTVAQILDRDDFQMRYQEGKPISLQEFLYPLAQAYDSVAVESDVELGGTDQKFNCLVGRDLQRAFGQEPQCVISTPLLVGTDGEKKMSKSIGNYIGITDDPDTMYGRVMSIPDSALVDYYKLATNQSLEWIADLEKVLMHGQVNPMEVKKDLARLIVTRYHSEGAAEKAEEQFVKVFSQREIPDDMPEFHVTDDMKDEEGKVGIVKLITSAGMASSNSKAKRLINQGAVTLDGERIDDFESRLNIKDGQVLRVGKRRFAKILDLALIVREVCGKYYAVIGGRTEGIPGTSYSLVYSKDHAKKDGKDTGDPAGTQFIATSVEGFIDNLREWVNDRKEKNPDLVKRFNDYLND